MKVPDFTQASAAADAYRSSGVSEDIQVRFDSKIRRQRLETKRYRRASTYPTKFCLTRAQGNGSLC